MKPVMRSTVLLACLLSLSIFIGPAHAEESDVPPVDAASKEVWKAKAAPNENHKALDPLAGEWQFQSRWWMQPDAAPEVSEGSSSNEWIFGGRFLKQQVKGTAMGEAFEGLSLIGYDNVKEEYQSVWLDSMSTGIMTTAGKYDPETRTLSESGKFSCPMTGEKDKEFRGVLTIIDDDNYTYEGYSKHEGHEFKTMEINYQRK